MTEAFICDFIRTPVGRFGGALAAAIAIGHQLGISIVCVTGTAALEQQSAGGRFSFSIICVAQGIATVLERV